MKSFIILFVFCIFNYGAFALVNGKRIEKVVSLSLHEGNVILHDGLINNWVARANFTDTTFDDGWSYLEVETKSKISDLVQSYAAGYVEGAASQTIIYNSWRNTQEGFCKWKGEEFCDNLRDFLSKNKDWMMKQIKEKSQDSPLWYQVQLILSQLTGLYSGFTEVSNHSIPFEDILLMNLSGDLEDLANVVDPKRRNMTFDEWVNDRDVFSDGHCSAIIKVLPKNSDLLVSHVTWNTYQSMLRVQKKYILPFKRSANDSDRISGHVASFSSYPAYLHSGDDFYVLSSGLVTMETTIGNSNPVLWRKVKPEGELQEWIRVIVANRLSTSGLEWSKTFEKYNSGTYNNQWMVIDYKLFKPGKPIKPNTLFVLEQIPGLVKFSDHSEVLRKRSYWPSYNVASFKEVFALSGGPALVKKYGDWFSYDRTPRALIFARNHSQVQDMTSIFALMRYNDYTHDPLSKCNCTPPYSAENAISARNDLNPASGTYPFSALGHRSHGGTDVKATNSHLAALLRFQAVNGPTYDQQPVFKWSEQDFAKDTPHYGHPDAWKFPVVQHKWVW